MRCTACACAQSKVAARPCRDARRQRLLAGVTGEAACTRREHTSLGQAKPLGAAGHGSRPTRVMVVHKSLQTYANARNFPSFSTRPRVPAGPDQCKGRRRRPHRERRRGSHPPRLHRLDSLQIRLRRSGARQERRYSVHCPWLLQCPMRDSPEDAPRRQRPVRLSPRPSRTGRGGGRSRPQETPPGSPNS